MPRLVFVHGVGGNRSVDEQRSAWITALAEGSRRAGHGALASDLTCGGRVEVVFAKYGDLFSGAQAQGADPTDLTDDEAQLLLELLRVEVATRLEDEQSPEDRAGLLHAGAQLESRAGAQGPGDLVRRCLNVATTLVGLAPFRLGQWASAKLMVRDLAQVARYLARGEPDSAGITLDARIRSRVRECLGDGPAVVVAHSLGTVVALETLVDFRNRVPLFVTIGSPIATRTVVWPRLRPRPPRTPEVVERWLNFWDRDDVVVARVRLENDLKPNERGVLPVTDRVDSDGLWVHPAATYLTHPGVAGPIAESIGRLGDPGQA